jgi:hypothetical protein
MSAHYRAQSKNLELSLGPDLPALVSISNPVAKVNLPMFTERHRQEFGKNSDQQTSNK